MITSARLLHIDGHDTPAVERAASLARRHGVPVTVDVDTIYHGFDRVLNTWTTWSPPASSRSSGPMSAIRSGRSN